MYDDTQQNRESVHTSTGYAYESFYCDRVHFLCAERFETGSGFHPPPPRDTQTKIWTLSFVLITFYWVWLWQTHHIRTHTHTHTHTHAHTHTHTHTRMHCFFGGEGYNGTDLITTHTHTIQFFILNINEDSYYAASSNALCPWMKCKLFVIRGLL